MANRAAVAVRLAVTLVLAPAATGCLVAAGAGAASGVYLTTRGAESLVDDPIQAVASRTRTVFQQMQIAPAGTRMDGDGRVRELKGTSGELAVTVAFEPRSDSTTQVEVTARKSTVEWDKDFAKDVLERIVSGQ